MTTVVVASAAGFIGANASEVVFQDGHCVVGLDTVNDDYGVCPKHRRLNWPLRPDD